MRANRQRRGLSSHRLQTRVVEDERLAAGALELDDSARVLSHVGQLGDRADAEGGVPDLLAAAELAGETRGFVLGVAPLAGAIAGVGHVGVIDRLDRLRRDLVEERRGY